MSGITKRSSRLASRDPPIKATSERKLRSGKAINKNMEKVNVGARNKRLHVSSVKDASLHNNSQPLSKRLRPRKNRRNYCEDSKLLQLHISAKQQNSMVILEKLSLTDGKKVPIYQTMKSPEKLLEEKKNDVYDFTFDSDDTQRKVAKKKGKKNVNKTKGKVKKTVRKKVVQPKAIKPPELSTNPLVKIAACNFLEPAAESVGTRSTRKNIMEKPKTHKVDTNIQKLEEPVKEDISKAVVTKSTRKNIVEEPKMPEISINIQRLEASVEEDISKAETLKINTDIQTAEKSIKEDTVKMVETSGLSIASQIAGEWANEEDIMEVETFKDTKIQATEDTTLADRTFLTNQDVRKPRIISIENADNIIITKSPPKNTEDLQPFRSKIISNNKTPMKESTNTLNCSLLTKSLSPIVKTINTMTTESPWCPRKSLMFSGTKHFVQSTPNTNFKTHKQKMVKNKGNTEIDKENVEMDKENMKIDKENIDINKENKRAKHIERNKKEISIHKKPILSKKLPINQISENGQPACVSEPVIKPAPARMLLGEIKNLLQTNERDINKDSKQADTYIKEGDALKMEKNKNLVDLVNFSDTFDIMSEIENQSISNGVTVPLFVDLEPSHFVEPPQRSYKRKRGVRFNFSHDSCEEEEEEEGEKEKKRHAKKKKLTKSEKEHMKRVDNWVKSINSTFDEIDKYDLLVE